MRVTVQVALPLALALALGGCVANGQQYAGNVYKADTVNKQQEATTVKIIAVLPAKVEVDNAQGKRNAQLIGGLLGATGGGIAGNAVAKNKSNGIVAGAAAGGAAGVAAGTLVPDKVLVDGVSITYQRKKKTLNSVQVGRDCEFVPGKAVMILTDSNETRIQPNATCPEKNGEK